MDMRFRSRKFIVAMVAIVLSFCALGLGWITGAQWVGLIPWLVASYMGGNVGDTVAEKRNAQTSS